MFPEIYPTAQYYGHSRIVRSHFGLPRMLPLSVGVQHGFVLGKGHEADFVNGPERLLVWSERSKNLYEKISPEADVRVAGAPFVMFLNQKKHHLFQGAEGSGSIVFPSHSSHGIHVDQDDLGYARWLSDLPKDYHPITVCLYYVDIKRGRAKPYDAYGFECVSVSHSRLDPLFLEKFIALCAKKRFAILNSISSAALYAVALGMITTIDPWKSEIYSNGNPWYDKSDERLGQELKNEIYDMFAFPEPNLRAQREFVSYELGVKYLDFYDELKTAVRSGYLSSKYIKNALKHISFSYFRASRRRVYKLVKEKS